MSVKFSLPSLVLKWINNHSGETRTANFKAINTTNVSNICIFKDERGRVFLRIMGDMTSIIDNEVCSLGEGDDEISWGDTTWEEDS
ncbi:hypothetical protein FK481_0093 [Listeria phage LP-010]|uniref:Uncharacterized protein n=5 Tax=Homburgvirus TaxID=1921125 RepID=A0A6C0QZZ9_9CAUD|nr:hypothetical protein P70_00110 [Listeria phage P70]QDK04607.1 hypothetical protein FK481_0093 [Listeria phage LP-010]QDK04718.1 hypothetical protein FK482_0096 [Listeria phage LP-013]QDK04831.1 hypothetical protein FK484_0098 [Listeria phage LP-031]QHZ59440.1 hypothetical protein FK483_0097 [Listeria phage LP-018]AFQ96299.1 hypothetical protein P70_00110 [Listeria phage P70]